MNTSVVRRECLWTRRLVGVLPLVVALVLLAGVLWPTAAHAQVEPPAPEPRPQTAPSILYLPQVLAQDGAVNAAAAPAAAGVETAVVGVETAARQPAAPIKLIIDTDPGVDDAVAIGYVLSQQSRPVTVLGVVSVGGNTDIYNTTNNALTILEKLGRSDIPVIMGRQAPDLSKTGWFIHGKDGLWFLGYQNPHDLSQVAADPVGFYCTTAAANPGAVLLALGPLTNVAAASQACPAAMRQLGQVVVLGGARSGGNKTPVAEFNFWQDPGAAAQVLAAGLPVVQVPLDAFSIPTITAKDVEKLTARGSAFVKFLAPALQQYVNVQLQNGGRAGIPDAVAAVMALEGTVGVRQPALVMVLPGPGLARGQSVVGLTVADRVSMIAPDAELSALAEQAFAYPPDPNFNLQWALGAILMRMPDNVQFTTSVPANLLDKTVLPALRGR